MADAQEIELVFEPQDEGGYHAYAPDLFGLHTQGEDMDDAMANASEAVTLYVEGLREDGESLDGGMIRHSISCRREFAPTGRFRRAPDQGSPEP
jgi:predicted RNase H-like HicB family nuclease